MLSAAFLFLCGSSLAIETVNDINMLYAVDDVKYDSHIRQLKTSAENGVRNESGVIYFFHVHKAGGTTLCHLAHMNGLAMDKNFNCNPGVVSAYDLLNRDVILCKKNRVQDGKSIDVCNPWLKGNDIGMVRYEEGAGAVEQPLWRWSAAEQAEFAKTTPYHLVGNERYLPEEMVVGGGFAYITIVRDPLDRALSQYNHESKHRPAVDIPPGTSFKAYLRKYCVDNLMVRGFGGPAAANAPAGGITRAHLEAAKRRLDHFSLVLLLDELDDVGMLLVKDMFGWQITKHPRGRVGQVNHSRAAALAAADPEAHRLLLAMHRWDLELWHYAQYLARSQVAAREVRLAEEALQEEKRKRKRAGGGGPTAEL